MSPADVLDVVRGSSPPARERSHRILVMSVHLPAGDHAVMDPAPARYAIRIHGHLGAMVLSAFPTLDSQRQGADTVLTGQLDRSALYGVLSEIESLGLELLEIRRQRPRKGRAP